MEDDEAVKWWSSSRSTCDLPAVVFHDGLVLEQPTLTEVAAALGLHTQPSSTIYDLAIVGSGPAGLAATVYGASDGLRTFVMESQSIGGQAGASSMIRNRGLVPPAAHRQS